MGLTSIILATAVVAAFVPVAPTAAFSPKEIRRLTTTLSTAGDHKVLTTSAERLAASGQSEAVQALKR